MNFTDFHCIRVGKKANKTMKNLPNFIKSLMKMRMQFWNERKNEQIIHLRIEDWASISIIMDNFRDGFEAFLHHISHDSHSVFSVLQMRPSERHIWKCAIHVVMLYACMHGHMHRDSKIEEKEKRKRGEMDAKKKKLCKIYIIEKRRSKWEKKPVACSVLSVCTGKFALCVQI